MLEVLPRQVFPEGLMPSCRASMRDTLLEKLSELLTWNVSFVQNKTEHLAKMGQKAAL